MNKTISVVIPIYNVEKYLRECLDSVVNQTYKNLQIILVDDGSTDNSGKICDEYAEKDNRITVIHQKNAGAGAAKNTGLDLVTGEYLSLIDSDDCIELNMYETMVNYLEQHKVDVVQCCFDNYFVNEGVKRKFNFVVEKYRIVSSTRYLHEMLYDWKYAIFWNKIFKISLLKDIRFPEGRKIDDEFFTYKLICNAKKIVNISDCFYHYRMRSNSVMNKNQSSQLLLDRIDCFKERYFYISLRYPKLGKYFYEKFSDYLVFSSKEKYDEGTIKIVQEYINEFPYKNICICERLKLFLFLRNYSADKKLNTENKEYFL